MIFQCSRCNKALTIDYDSQESILKNVFPQRILSVIPCDCVEPGRRRRFKPMPKLTDSQIARFWSKVEKSKKTQCWPWKASRNPDGYGATGFNRETYRAPRVAYFLATGIDPEVNIVRHSCDNPPCCNPAHLLAGTDRDNMLDRDIRARGGFGNQPVYNGVRNSQARMTEEQVLEMRALYLKGVTQTVLAKKFRLGRTTVHHIIHRDTWTHI